LHSTRAGFNIVKKRTKELVGDSELKFEKTVYIKVKVLSKLTTDESGKGWKQFLFKPHYENNSIMLKCFDLQSGGVHIEEFDMDFNKMKTVDIQQIQDEDKKNPYWFVWKISALPHEFACTSQRDLEEWTQNIRYLHNRIAVSKAKIKAAEVSGIAPKKKREKKTNRSCPIRRTQGSRPFCTRKNQTRKRSNLGSHQRNQRPHRGGRTRGRRR